MRRPKAAPPITRESLPKTGRSLRLFAVFVILLLSFGLVVVAYSAWQTADAPLRQMMGGRTSLLGGFALLMLLTVVYLAYKGLSITHHQSVLIERLVDKEAAKRALQLDPILEFHHPAVCAELMMRQASYASRVHSRLGLVELKMPELPKLWEDRATRPFVEQFFAQLRRQCRPLDGWVRWTDSSLLLILVQVTEDEITGVVYRWRTQVERWWDLQASIPSVPETEWRYLTVGRLGDSGDILEEARQHLNPDHFMPTPMPNVWQPKPDMRNGSQGKSGNQPGRTEAGDSSHASARSS